MKKLGLIGGTSWHSTVEYYRAINEGVSKIIGSQANPELILYSINIEIMRAQDKDAINAKYLEVAKKLEAAGAEAIVICANTPHMAYEYVQPQIGIEILHIADATGREAKRLGLKKLGLLGNKPTITGSFISARLNSKFNIETIKPHSEATDQSHYFVSEELTRGVFSDEARSFYKVQIQKLKEAGADGVIMGCTELPILMKEVDTVIPALATTDLHVQMAIDFITS
ncbi:amino acid racemase [Cryomorpha ignava]|uniref:Amino acid racemase n=1 Tax=Cryomorpha ignava TaxID=101383 RepID=A0A7K3WP54_9FLAO|nr:amino acid racemase [Cryomorpha ignava]NEN23284.1 amino acid racemase [Cryomorpha ignava]